MHHCPLLSWASWLMKAMGLRPCKIQMCQPLKEGDTVRRRDFVNNIVEELENGSISEYKIWFNDEAHFQWNGYVNKTKLAPLGYGKSSSQCRLATATTKNRNVVCHIVETDNWSDIHRIFTGMVTGKKYAELLEHYFGLEVNRLNMSSRYWFMQDGALTHRTDDIFL